MTRRDWWLGVGAVVAAVLLHAAIPRYTWREFGPRAPYLLVRLDRWTGHADLGSYDDNGRWARLEPVTAAPNKSADVEPLPSNGHTKQGQYSLQDLDPAQAPTANTPRH